MAVKNQHASVFHWISQLSIKIWIWEHCLSTSSSSKATKKTSNPEEEAQLNYVGRLARKMVEDPVVVMWEHYTSSSSSTLDCNSLEVKIVVEEHQKRQLRIP